MRSFSFHLEICPSVSLLPPLFYTALIILFGDSVYAMFGGYLTPAAFKAIGLAIILPTIFLPLNLLSPVSVIGIVSTFTLFGVVLLDGLIKKEAPGSLWQPATTHLLPEWSRFPLSFGLIMSGFSSHPIIPSLYKDMRDPRKFSKMLNLAYVGATIIYLSMGMVGVSIWKDPSKECMPRFLSDFVMSLTVMPLKSPFQSMQCLATRSLEKSLKI